MIQRRARGEMPVREESELQEGLSHFAGALRLESHHLTGEPELLWQQMHNRLQWFPELDRELDRARRERPDGAPWLRLRTRTAESKQLERTIELACSCFAVASDGSRLVCPRIWPPEGGPGVDEFFEVDVKSGAAHVLLEGSPEPVSSCALRPGGTELVVGGQSGAVWLWDHPTAGDPVALRGHPDEVRVCRFSPDGSSLASGGGRKEDREELKELETRLAQRQLQPDRRRWLEDKKRNLEERASAGRAVRVWSLEDRCEKWALTAHRERVSDAVFTPDGDRLVTASFDGTLRVWDVEAGRTQVVLEHGSSIFACAVSPDGSQIVSAGFDSRLVLWDGDGREVMALGETGTDSAMTCAWGPDGRVIAAGHESGVLRLWDVETRTELAILRGHARGIHACAFSPDGSRLLSAALDGTVKVWNAFRLGSEEEAPRSLSWALGEGGVLLRSEEDGQGLEVRRLQGEEAALVEMESPRPTGRRLVNRDGSLAVHQKAVWDLETGEPRAQLPDLSGSLLTLSEDGSWVVTWSIRDHSVTIWNAGTGEAETTFSTAGPWSPEAASSPSGAFIALVDRETLKIWKPGSRRPREAARAEPRAPEVCLVSPDDSFVLIDTSKTELALWDVARRRFRVTLEGHQGAVLAADISPDASRIVTAGWDGTARIWDSATGKQLAELEASGDVINACRFTPDGKMVLTGDSWEHAGRTLRVWSVENGRQLAVLPFLAGLQDLVVDAAEPRWVCLMQGRGYVVDLEGVSSGPVVVTPRRRESGLFYRCPACRTEHEIERTELSSTLTIEDGSVGALGRVPGGAGRCPNRDCRFLLCFTRFVLESKPSGRGWLSRLRRRR